MTQTLLTIACHELCELERIENDYLIEIVEYGIVHPMTGIDTEDWVFEVSHVRWIKKAVRLYQDLDIDWVAIAMVIELMQQKENLEKENARYQQQLERFLDA